MLGLLGVFLALGMLIYLAYRGVSVLLLGPAMALLAALFTAEAPLLATYTQVFMVSMGGFVIQFFPLFMLGAIFGKLMDDSGAAGVIARGIVKSLGPQHAILAVVLACAVLTYGGVSLFVVAFAVYPIAASLFQQSSLPKRLMPATIALGAFTFTMTALPGTPAIQNAIPMPYFGTTPFAAPLLGIITASIMFGLGQWWLVRRAAQAQANGEGYGESDVEKPPSNTASSKTSNVPSLSFVTAVSPVVLVIVLNYLLSAWIIPSLDTSYLQRTQFGEVSLQAVLGVWSIITSLTLACIWLTLLSWRQLTGLKKSLDDGASSSILPIFNTASLVGFGAVIASLPAFDVIKAFVEGLGQGNPLVALAVSVNLLAGVTGSASGGMSIALQTMGQDYLAMAEIAGIAPDLLHRVTTVATGGLDSLPHNGAVVTLLAICGLTHRQAYFDVFMVAVVFPLLALAVLVTLGTVFGSF